MNSPELFTSLISSPESVIRNSGQTAGKAGIGRTGRLLLCIVLSVGLHAFMLLGMDMRQDIRRGQARLVMIDIVAPPSRPAASATAAAPPAAPVPPPVEPVKTAKKTPARPPKPAVKTTSKRSHAVSRVKEAVSAKKRPEPDGKPRPEAAKPVEPAPAPPSGQQVPIGRLAERPGATILANESGADTLKHGAEARFMHGVATEEFVEENYVGEYALHDASRVWIEDDRARSGHLILHAEGMGLHRKLFRFNRFIYVYGTSPDSPEPILGSVIFFSDGYHIHQFLWEHNSTQAYFPRRK